MKYKSTLARGLSHAWPWTKPIGSSPTASRLLRYSLLCMLVLLGSGSMWADDATLAVDFEEETTSYTDWTFTNFATKQTNSGVAAHGGSYFGSTGGKSSGSLVTKEKLAKPKNIKFYISKTSTNSTASSWIIKVSTDGEEWTNVKTQSASADITKGTWTEVTQDLTSYTNVYVGIFYDGTTAIRTIDDVTLTYENVNDTRTATTIALADGYATTGVEGKTVALPTATVMAGENTVTGATVTWASSDENIATISGNTISLLSAGTATITATYAGDDSYKSSKATYDLTVTELSVDGLASMAIIFKDSGSSSDSGTKITSIDDIISEGNNYVSSIPTADNVYNGRTDRGLKLGASSKSATLTLTLAKAVKPIKITFDAMQYSATETSITVNGKTTTNLGSELATYSVIYDGETEVSSIEISTPSKRAYITNVKIYYEPEATPAPLYILGDMNSWDRTNPTKMTWDATKNAYTYELNNDATVSFCFADGTQTADEATADNEWSTFNSTYRWAPGEGDMEFPQRLVGFSITLLKVNGTIKLPAGTWTISIAPHDTPGEMGMTITGEATPVEEHTYIVAGSKAEIFGTSWDGTYEANKMTKQTDGTYQKTYTVDQAYEDVQLKVVKDGSDWIGDDNGYNVSFNLTGAGNFTVTINPETNVVSVTGDIVSFASTLDYESVYAVGNGEDAWLNGAAWDPAYQDNQMTEVSDGVWEISFENVPAGYARNIKFTIDGAWTHNFGGTFSEFGVATDAVYNGDNIEFDTENDLQNIKVQLDLSNFDFTTKEGAKFTISLEAAEEPSGDVTATWDFTSNANPRAVGLFNGTTGTLDSNVAGIVLDIDARNGKFDSQDRTSDAQVNSGTIINVPIKGAGDEVTVVGNWKVSYTIGSEAEAVTDLNKTYTATAADAQQGHVTITSTDNNTYFYSITVVQKATSGEEEEIEGLLYSWESPEGTVSETGGTANTYNGTAIVDENDDVNVANSTYYTLRLQGKNDFSTKNIVITLDNALHAGDIINITAYRNKNDVDKKAGALIKFEKGTTQVRTDTSDKQGLEFVNIDTSDKSANDQNRGTEPNTIQLTVPESAEGSKTLTLTRAQTGTNLFITKLVITSTAEDDPNAVATPEITPATGTFTSDQEVTITCATEGAKIYYTTDGTDPTAQSTEYTAAFTVSETTTVKAIAINGENKSDIAESVITITDVAPGSSDLEWDYTETAPTGSPDNGLNYESAVNDAAGTNNGMKGVKLNSSGYAWFTKNPVEGKLTLTFGNRKAADAYAVNVYSCDANGTKGDLIGEVSVSESPGTGSLDIPATVTGIRIERKTGSEGVLQKIVFKEKVPRTFVDFEITNDELKGTIADMNLPQGVTLTGTQPEAGNNSHGYINASISVPTDGGAVKFTFGGCQYANKSFTVTNSNNETIATLSNKTTNCYHQDASVVTYFYTGEATTLTFSTIPYLPYFKAEATDVQEVTVTFKDQNGKELGKKTVLEGQAIGEIPYTETDLTIPEGEKFRGWVYASGVKVQATDIVDGNKTVSASVTAIEKDPEVGSVQTYDLTQATFYPEDHENFSVEGGAYYNNHGFSFDAGGSFKVKVTGKAQIVLTLCQYGNGTTITAFDTKGAVIDNEIPAKADTDGSTTAINYEGPDGELTFTFATQTYLHSVKVYNVTDFLEKDEESGYIVVPAGDAAGLIMAINAASSEPNSKIFLPNGTYDLGETVLTGISGNNVSIIGQSMEGVIIKTAPPTSMEGLEKADLFINTGEGLYLQDLTLQNALDYYNAGSSGRAVTLHDKGTKTINKNVRHLSYQDTYYSHKVGGLYYFEGGEIHGTVDYMCGNGKAYFNEVTLVNERRSSATMTANSELYVFNNCTVKNNADEYNFGRAWSDNPVCVWLNTTLEDPSKLATTRWNLTGINCDYSIAGEYGTKNADGGDITPESNNITFKKANTTLNTILTADQAANYTIDKVLGEWATEAQAQATQVEAPVAELKNGVISWEKVNGATAYALFNNGSLMAIVDGGTTSYTVENGDSGQGAPALLRDGQDSSTAYTIRAANGRGGFGEPKIISMATGIKGINAELNGDVKIYDMQGRQVKTTTKGVYIINGKKVVIK